jgi:hypothetical protein
MTPRPMDPRFELTGDHVFLFRFGSAGEKGRRAPCNRKLCFVATDPRLLADLLDELAGEPDCFFVKFSVEPKDGMYLGRCFLTTPERIGEMWARFKPTIACFARCKTTTSSSRIVERLRSSAQERRSQNGFASKNASVSRIDSSRLFVGFQPRARRREASSKMRGLSPTQPRTPPPYSMRGLSCM